METKFKIWTVVIIVAIGIIAVAGVSFFQNSQPGKLDDFAKCLKDKGAVFYGAFWCPHCQDEKALFGNSAKYLPYVECSTADSNGQLPVCKNEKIEVYPTWKFADGSKNEGEMGLAKLAEKTGCVLPE